MDGLHGAGPHGARGCPARFLGRVSGRHVPQAAITAYLGFSLVFTLGVGGAIGALGVYGFAETILGVGMVLTYSLMSLALIGFYWWHNRTEVFLFRREILPVFTVLLMLLPLYGLLWPPPDFPERLVPAVVVGWMMLGGIYLVLERKYRPSVVAAMGRVFEDTGISDGSQSDLARTSTSDR